MLLFALPDGPTRLVCEIWAKAYARALGTYDVAEAEAIADKALARFKSKMNALEEDAISRSPVDHIGPDPAIGRVGLQSSSDHETLAVRVTDTDEAWPKWMDAHVERVWGERRHQLDPEDDRWSD